MMGAPCSSARPSLVVCAAETALEPDDLADIALPREIKQGEEVLL